MGDFSRLHLSFVIVTEFSSLSTFVSLILTQDVPREIQKYLFFSTNAN